MNTTNDDVQLSSTAGLARAFWMMLGNILLLVLCLSIARQLPWTFTWRDGAYALGLGTLLAVRWIDITRLGGRTADGDPATTDDWRRWALRTSAFAAAGWCFAQAIGL
jgi:hypothetical protein